MLSFRILLENRIDFLQKYYEDKLKKTVPSIKMPSFKELEDADPTNKKLYLQWLINQVFITRNSLYKEDVYKVKDARIIFDRIKRQFLRKISISIKNIVIL